MIPAPTVHRARIYADRPSWLDARPGADGCNIGASELAILFGLSPYRSLWSLWQARRANRPLPDDDAEDCAGPEEGEAGDEELPPEDPRARGQRWEHRVGEEYGAYTGRVAVPAGEAFGARGALVSVQHPVLPWAWASPDFLTFDPDEGLGVVETKTDVGRGWKWGRSGTVVDAMSEDILPPHYHLQAMQLIACLDVAFCDVAVLLGSYRFRWFRVRRNPAEEAQVLRRASEIRDRHLVRGDPPEVDDSDECAAWYRAAYRGRDDGMRRATDEEVEDVLAIVARKEADARAKLARGRLLAAMKGLSCLVLPAGPLGEKRGVRRSATGRLTVYGW